MAEQGLRDRSDNPNTDRTNRGAGSEPLVNRVYSGADRTTVTDSRSQREGYEGAAPDRFKDNEYGAALKAAQEQGKPLVIKVGAEWCGPCRNLDGNLKSSDVQQLLDDKAVFLRVDVDRAPEVARALGVTSYPTTIIGSVGADGRLRTVDTFVGSRDPMTLRSMLGNDIAAAEKQLPPKRVTEKQVDSDPERPVNRTEQLDFTPGQTTGRPDQPTTRNGLYPTNPEQSPVKPGKPTERPKRESDGTEPPKLTIFDVGEENTAGKTERTNLNTDLDIPVRVNGKTLPDVTITDRPIDGKDRVANRPADQPDPPGVKRDQSGLIKEINYPEGNLKRTFSHDASGKLNRVTETDEDGKRTFVQGEDGKWALKAGHVNLPIQGDIQLSRQGDYTYRDDKGVSHITRPDGKELQEKALSDGSDARRLTEGPGRAQFNLDDKGRVESIKYPSKYDNEKLTFGYDENNKINKYTWSGSDAYPGRTFTRQGNSDIWNCTYADGRDGGSTRMQVDLGKDGVFKMNTFQADKPSPYSYNVTPEGTGYRERTDKNGAQVRVNWKDDNQLAGVQRSDGTSVKCTWKDNELIAVSDRNTATGQGSTWSKQGDKWISDSNPPQQVSKLSAGSDGQLRFQDTNGVSGSVNTDGTSVITKLDRSKVEIGSDGLVRKVSNSSGDYRNLEYENGKLIKIADTNKSGQSATWDARDAGSEKRENLKVHRDGDIEYQRAGGTKVIDKANLQRIELDPDGSIIRSSNPNGSSRAFTYATAADGSKALTSVTDSQLTAKGERAETWRRQQNVDGTYGDKFTSTNSDGKVKTREGIEVLRDGDYRYKGGDGKDHIAKTPGREIGDGYSTDDIKAARDNLTDALRAAKFDDARMTRMQKMMDRFDQRMDERSKARKVAGITEASKIDEQTQKAIANTYNNLAQMVESNPKGALYDQATRAKLAENFMYHAADTTSMDQGHNTTCWIEAAQIAGGMVNHPDDMARLLKEVSLTGTYTSLNSGENDPRPQTTTFNRDLFKMGWEEANWSIGKPDNDASRSPVGMIFDRALPVIGGRGDFNEGAGWYNNPQRTDGARRIMYMVTGDVVHDSNNLLDGSEQKTLLEKGAFINYGDKHMRTEQLVKEGDKWYIVQDDQHGRNGDTKVAYVSNLAAWVKQNPGDYRYAPGFARLNSDTPEPTVGMVQPEGTNTYTPPQNVTPDPTQYPTQYSRPGRRVGILRRLGLAS